MMSGGWFVALRHETAETKKRGASGEKVNIQNNAYHKRRKQRFSKNSHGELALFDPLHQLLARFRIGFSLPERFEQFLQTRLVLVALGALARRLDPFGMLHSQIFVNLPLELCVSMNRVRHGNW